MRFTYGSQLQTVVTKATAAGAISDLVNLVSELSSNTYLKHSPLWSNGALDAPDAGEIIDDVKKA